ARGEDLGRLAALARCLSSYQCRCSAGRVLLLPSRARRCLPPLPLVGPFLCLFAGMGRPPRTSCTHAGSALRPAGCSSRPDRATNFQNTVGQLRRRSQREPCGVSSTTTPASASWSRIVSAAV